MAIRLVSGGGDVIEASAIGMSASGVIHVGGAVEFSRTGGAGVFPASSSSTFTNIFGVSLSYAQGASDIDARVIPIVPGQLWEIDCVNASTTSQVGLRHALENDLLLRNNATDVTTALGIFRAVAMTGLTSGSGKLIGEFVKANIPQFGFTTFA
jgi:hypothetical protein